MATLLSLPVEVIRRISMYLCKHCQLGSDLGQGRGQSFKIGDWFHPSEWITDIGLVSLASTCRVLRDVTLPIALHCPAAYMGGRVYNDQLGSSKAFPLVRTLLERPDHAQYVQELCFFDWEDDPYELEVSRDTAALFEAKMLGCLDPPPAFWRSHPESAPGDLLLQLFRAMRESSVNEYQLITTDYSYCLKAVALACVPNVRRLWFDSPPCDNKICAATLPFLEELVIKPATGSTDEYSGSYASIFAGAPSLRAVRITLSETVVYLEHHSGVTELYLESCTVSPSHLYATISKFPSLRIFHFEDADTAQPADGDELVNPLQAYDAFRQRSSTLEHLSLALYLEDPHIYSTAARITDMREMSKLETLDLGGMIVDLEALNFEKEGLGIFPSTVRRLTLRGMIKEWGPVRLCYMVKEGRFPRLEELVVDARHELVADEAVVPIMAACTEKRVKCEINYWIRFGGTLKVEGANVTNAEFLAQHSGRPRQHTGPRTNMEREVDRVHVGLT